MEFYNYCFRSAQILALQLITVRMCTEVNAFSLKDHDSRVWRNIIRGDEWIKPSNKNPGKDEPITKKRIFQIKKSDASKDQTECLADPH